MFEFEVITISNESIKEKFVCPFCEELDCKISEDNLNSNIVVVICNSCGCKTIFKMHNPTGDLKNQVMPMVS